jgi:DNA-binding transcriptional regulator YhcF (GntR family)
MRANNESGAPSANAVYDEIYSYVSQWSISPTIRELAQSLNCGHSTVQRRITELASSGSIIVYGGRSRGIAIRGKK